MLYRGKQIVFISVFIFMIFIIFEGSLRMIYKITRGTPFFKPSDIVYSDYPELRRILKQADGSSSRFKILILSSSAFIEKFGHLPFLLEEKLRSKGVSNYVIYNLCDLAQSSRDSYLKYEALLKETFDVVVIYHGTNETRANNCPPELFRDDYSHCAWYEVRNLTNKYRSIMNFTVIPYSVEYLYIRLKEALFSSRYIPEEIPKEEWIRYGVNVKTDVPFRKNIEAILLASAVKGEAVILMTYAYYLPYNYSNKAFLDHELDYAYTENSLPVYLWGNTYHVALGIETHNAVTRKLATDYPFVRFLDMAKIIPKDGSYFSDFCHLSPRGSAVFAETLSNTIAELYKKKKS